MKNQTTIKQIEQFIKTQPDQSFVDASALEQHFVSKHLNPLLSDMNIVSNVDAIENFKADMVMQNDPETIEVDDEQMQDIQSNTARLGTNHYYDGDNVFIEEPKPLTVEEFISALPVI